MTREPWIQTYTGNQFSYHPESVNRVDIIDIARALSHICRFTGHCRRFYSVAQHSVLVSQNTKNAFLGLMHDAAEAYVGDVNRPLKEMMGRVGGDGYFTADDVAWKSVCRTWPILNEATIEERKDCKNTDLRMLVTESHDLLMNGPHHQWQINQETHPRYDFKITPWEPDYAMEKFFQRFEELTK